MGETYRCRNCGARNDRWEPGCPLCGPDGHLVVDGLVVEAAPEPRDELIKPLIAFKPRPKKRILTGDEGLDRVLGGGLAVPSTTIIAGQPGCGKTSLLMCMAAMARDFRGEVPLYISSEEDEEDLRTTAERFGLEPWLDVMRVKHEDNWPRIRELLHLLDPQVVVIDSANDLKDDRFVNPRDELFITKEIIYEIVAEATEHERAIVVVSHINKEGDFAGLKKLQHRVSTVMMIENVTKKIRRLHCPFKNRKGSIENEAFYLMTDQGLREIEVEKPDEEEEPELAYTLKGLPPLRVQAGRAPVAPPPDAPPDENNHD